MRTKLLILEKNPAIGGMWRDALAKANYDVKLHVPGADSRSSLAKWGSPDILVSGLELEGGRVAGGREVCERFIGDVPKGKLVPLVQTVSGVPRSTDGETAFGVAFVLLRKPVKIIDLLEKVRKADFRQLQSRLFRRGPPAIIADLGDQELTALCDQLNREGASGALLVDSATHSGSARFDSGEVIDAVNGLLVGEEAMLEMLIESSGHACFFESSVRGVVRDAMIPDVRTLSSSAMRMREEMAKAERSLSFPNAVVRRSDDCVVNDRAIFSDQVYIALEEPKSFDELRHELGMLTRRQLLVALYGMMARNEIAIERLNRKQSALRPESCARIVKRLGDGGREVQFRLPVSIGVFAFPPTAAKRFLGVLAGVKMAGEVSLASGNDVLSLTAFGRHDGVGDFQRHAGVIVIVKREDIQALPRVLKFMEDLKRSHVKAYTVAVASRPNLDANYTASCAGLLKVDDPDVRFVPLTWTKSSCLKVLDAFLKSTCE